MPTDTAILLFTRTPEEEARHKQFVPHGGRRGNRRVASQLIAHAKRTAFLSELPVFVVDSQRQVGASFGERLTHAFQDVFDKGFVHVIAIGNDTPTLSAEALQEAARQVQHYGAALGPTHNGGAYVIALHRDAFKAESFATLPWETASLFDALSVYAEDHAGDYFTLALHRDANTVCELVAIVDALPYHTTLYRVLASLLRTPLSVRMRSVLFDATLCIGSSILGRAPPALALH